MYGAITPASAIRLEAGTGSGAWWPRWNGILANWSPVSASSSPTCPAPPSGWGAFYNQRGKAEQHINAGENAIKRTRLSCRKFRDNEVRLQLHALAYNLANFMRTLALPKEVEHWSLTTLQEKLVKIGAKVVGHGRHGTFQLAEVAVPRSLFQKILAMIDNYDEDPFRRRPRESTAR